MVECNECSKSFTTLEALADHTWMNHTHRKPTMNIRTYGIKKKHVNYYDLVPDVKLEMEEHNIEIVTKEYICLKPLVINRTSKNVNKLGNDLKMEERKVEINTKNVLISKCVNNNIIKLEHESETEKHNVETGTNYSIFYEKPQMINFALKHVNNIKIESDMEIEEQNVEINTTDSITLEHLKMINKASEDVNNINTKLESDLEVEEHHVENDTNECFLLEPFKKNNIASKHVNHTIVFEDDFRQNTILVKDKEISQEKRIIKDIREKPRQRKTERRKFKQSLQIIAEPSTYINIKRIKLNNEEITHENSQIASYLKEKQTFTMPDNKQSKKRSSLQKKRARQQRYREQNREKLKQREAERRKRKKKLKMFIEPVSTKIVIESSNEEIITNSQSLSGLKGNQTSVQDNAQDNQNSALQKKRIRQRRYREKLKRGGVRRKSQQKLLQI